uniref:NADH dehydrogenase subunit 9 n=1 Tax=Paracercomonas marina TaxID=372086 RepID=A0A0B5GCM7_9EUKA|nr:NADH dehydrogenase subunit 9 [Paracercomonas marina]AJF22841.1 NADH dehydrogenase subunit 9 [Paracercomonas marina]
MTEPVYNSNYVFRDLAKHFSTLHYYRVGGKYLLRAQEQHLIGADFSLRVTKQNLGSTILALKYDWYKQFHLCMDIIAYDQPGKVYRFTVIYYLLTLVFNSRITVITQTSELKALETMVMVYSSTNWSEREVWDMYGIMFLYHPDLRRILTDYGFSGFPLRKDFPLTGFKEVIYSDYNKNTEYRDVELSQEFRKTDYHKAWKPVKFWQVPGA